MKAKKSDWIFYLRLSKRLPEHFFDLDSELKKHDITLVPITISELMSMTKGDGKFHVVTCVKGFSEAKYFAKKVQKISSLLIRNRRMNMFISSSFGFINQTHLYGKTNHYHYFSLPIQINHLCAKISSEVYKHQTNERRWPGLSRGLGTTVS